MLASPLTVTVGVVLYESWSVESGGISKIVPE
jgi:hypothetical protein